MARNEGQKREIVTFRQLLGMAHEKGLLGIETEALTVEDGFAFFRAKVTLSGGDDGEALVYTGHAEATKNNVAPAMQSCLPRMAETRAVVRALRLAVNVGEVAAEELSGYDDSAGVPQTRTQVRQAAAAKCPHCKATGQYHAPDCPNRATAEVS